jgi:trans-aconitate 2-methyltransferase
MAAADWNARLYDSSHAFVWQSARDLAGLLDAQPGEQILDVGCGTGHLTAELARSGARVLGIDSSDAMIAQARTNFPDLQFETADANALSWHGEFDAVFSNAALHWVNPPDAAASSMVRALKPGGRLVVEFGGQGNIVVVLAAAFHALSKLGVAGPERLNPWYFPGIAEYAGLLESNGLEVTFAHLFDRPTPLENGESGLANWYRMFGGSFLAALPESAHADFDRLTAEFAAPALFRDGRWTADYRRIRMAGRIPV